MAEVHAPINPKVELLARARRHLFALERQFASAMEREEIDRTFITELLGAMHALRAEIKHLEG